MRQCINLLVLRKDVWRKRNERDVESLEGTARRGRGATWLFLPVNHQQVDAEVTGTQVVNDHRT